MSTAIQHSFAGGQLSPTIWNRVDHEKYASGLKKNRNMIVARDGSIMNRAGTGYVGTVKYQGVNVRLIPFEISLAQSYVLEFGDRYLHVIKNGSYIFAKNITVNAFPNGVAPQVILNAGTNQGITSADLYAGLIITFSCSTPITSSVSNFAKNRFFIINNVNISANTTTITFINMDGNSVDSTAWGSYTSNELTCNTLVTVVTPYFQADLPNIKFDQSVDVMTLCHPSYPPATLTYNSDTSWTLSNILFIPQMPNAAVWNLQVTQNGSGGGGGGASITKYWDGRPTQFSSPSGSSTRGLSSSSTIVNPASDNIYKVTAVNLTNGEESFPGMVLATVASATISAFTLANPCVLTLAGLTGAAPANGDQWSIFGTASQLDGKVYTISVIDGTHVSLNGIDSTNYTPWSISGAFRRTTVTSGTSAVPSIGTPTILKWNDGANGPGGLTFNFEYNVYASLGGVFGFIGKAPKSPGTNDVIFNDTGYVPDMSKRPPDYQQVMDSPNNYPSVSCYYQQRHCFSNTNNSPSTFFASQTGFFTNFTSNTPVQDSDAVIFQLVSTRIDPIVNMMDIGNLILFSQNAEYAVLGNNTSGQFGALTPTAINIETQSFHGCANLRPVRIDNSAIYLQSRGNVLRDLNYFFAEDKYKGNDLTIFAKDLFDNFTTVDMDYAETPNHNLFCIRNDGQVLCLTYVKEQQILAWGYWDSPNGMFQNVCVIPENGYDVAYFVVNRTVVDETGVPHTYQQIERMQIRIAEISNQSLMTFMDSTGTFNGTNTTVNTMRLTGGVNWNKNETLTLTCSSNFFVSGMVGQQIQITDITGKLIRFTINSVTNATVATGTVDDLVPAGLQAQSTVKWALALNQITGLWWLNGLTVSVLGDGYVVASPYNSAYKQLTVVNGILTLPNCYSVINIGIPYLSDVKTLDMDVVGYSVFMGKTAVDKWKNISEVTTQIVNTRGGFYGTADPQFEPANTKNDPLFKLYEMKGSTINDSFNACPPLITDNIKLIVQGGWDIHGNVFIRQPDPLPICLSSIAYSGNLPLRENEAPPQQGLPR